MFRCTENGPGTLVFLKLFNFPWGEFKDDFDDILRGHMGQIAVE